MTDSSVLSAPNTIEWCLVILRVGRPARLPYPVGTDEPAIGLTRTIPLQQLVALSQGALPLQQN
jgi:hypothetical protein